MPSWRPPASFSRCRGTAFIILRYAAEPGRNRLARVIAGAVLGDAAALAICSFGLGALLVASSGILTLLKVAAAADLIGLGVLTLCRKPASVAVPRTGVSRPFLGVFLVTALNPKGIAICGSGLLIRSGVALATGRLT